MGFPLVTHLLLMEGLQLGREGGDGQLHPLSQAFLGLAWERPEKLVCTGSQQ